MANQPVQQPGAPGQQGYPAGYNPYAQQQGGYAGGYAQQPYGQQQGGYGGYPQHGGYQGGAYNQGGYVPPQGRQGGGFPGQQNFQPRQPQAFQPRQQQQQFSAEQQSAPVADSKPAGPAKTVSLSIGGASSATVPKSNEPRKVISLGAKKPADAATKPAQAKAVSISIGGGAKKPASDAANSSAASTRASTPAVAAKKQEKTEEPADWEEAEPAPAPKAAAAEATPTSEAQKSAPTESKVKVSTGTTNFSRAAARNDTDAIAKEAAQAADEDTLKELYGGDIVDPNGTYDYLTYPGLFETHLLQGIP